MVKFFVAATTALVLGTAAQASTTTIFTDFNQEDGFVTGGTGDTTLSNDGLSVTFSGGQQQQMFNPNFYRNGPAAFLFINGELEDQIAAGPGDGTASGDGIDDDTGLIDFNVGVSEVSFFAANVANGPFSLLTIFGEDDTSILGTVNVFNDFIPSPAQDPDLTPFTFSAANFQGSLIGSIGIDLPGPNQNAPYALAIDGFTVTAEIAPVPLPAGGLLLLSALGGLVAVRRRNKNNA